MISNISNFLYDILSTPLYLSKALLQYSKPTISGIQRSRNSLIIVCNGPSLNASLETILQVRDDHDLLVVNNIAQSEVYTALKPEYYLLADPAFFNNENQIALKTLDKIFSETSWDMNFLLPANCEEKLDDYYNSHIARYYYNKTSIGGIRFVRQLLYKWGFGLPSCTNVLMPSLLSGVNMGYKVIYIFGADFSWLKNLNVDFEKNTILSDEHFYDKKVVYRNLSSENKEHNTNMSISQQVFNFYRMLKNLDRIHQYAGYMGANIYNCSEQTMIESFPRLRFTTLST